MPRERDGIVVAHLTASPFFGGPERQMLGLSLNLPQRIRSIFLCYTERGLAQPFTQKLQKHGLTVVPLMANAPHLLASSREVADHLRRLNVDVLCCHGYKPDIVGCMAAWRAGIPVVSVSRGWTYVTAKVRVYEALDMAMLHLMNRVVCVSQGQARKVRRLGVPRDRIRVIRNAIEVARFDNPQPAYRALLHGYFSGPPSRVVLAAGRLSPEKGFDVLIDAAEIALRSDPTIRFVHFGDGPMRGEIERQIEARNLVGRFVLAGFRSDVDQFIPHADAVVLPSHTEGLPNVALEASAASVPVVATAVGGTPEVVVDGESGYLVPPANPRALARRILDVLASEPRRVAMGQRGRQHVCDHFTFASQVRQYGTLFEELLGRPAHAAASSMVEPSSV